jgi:glutamyl/glutaminyl-tRNA synthetase
MYRAAEYLIEAGHAYVDEQTPENMRANRGDFGKPGVDSPFRTRTPAENLERFRQMAQGQHADGAMVLRAKIDMASPNINMRDPAIYRIRRATTTTPATNGASTRCTPLPTPLKTRWSRSPTASARWSLKTNARFTTG